MSTSRWFIALVFASMAVLSAQAEPHCPGNVASLRFPASSRSQIVVPVTINHAASYEFLVDTGTQFTIVDPSLVGELHLQSQGRAELAGVGFKTTTAFARVDSLEVGSQVITNHVIEIQDLKMLQAADLHFRGVLGGLFLDHFDVLIDYALGLLCLDDLKTMRSLVKGVRLELPVAPTLSGDAPTAGLVIVPVRLSVAGPRLLHLALDSGSNVLFLYRPDKYLPSDLVSRATVFGQGGNGKEQEFSILPSQKMEIGSLKFQQLSFVIPRQSDPDAPVDGLLPAVLFRTVFISYVDHFVVLNPR
jgi:Aspartyl protease